MALTDTRTIAIGVIIGLIVGGGIGYMIPQSKINDLSMDKDSLEEVNGELLRSLENAGLDFDRVMFHVDELVEIKRTLEGEIDELNKEITKKNQYITELEAELNISNEENPVIETRIPAEWVNQTTLSKLDLSNLTLKDPYNKYQVSSDTLNWNKINRTQNQGLVTTQFNLTHHIIEFDFQLDNFTFGEGGNRRMITFWAISDTENVSDTRSYTMLYAEQVTHREGIYELIFHQKQNNENMFVDVGIKFQLNTSYHCRILRYGDYAMYQVYTNSSKTEQLYDSGERFLVDNDYRYLYLGYMYPPSKPNDLHITNSGKISYINILDSNN